MSSITIVSAQGHGGGGNSVAVDVSEFSTLRLTLEITAANSAAFQTGSVHPNLEVWLETSSDNATWTRLQDFDTVTTATAAQRVIIATHDVYLRAGWHAWSMAAGVDPGFVWGITGEAKPDTPE